MGYNKRMSEKTPPRRTQAERTQQRKEQIIREAILSYTGKASRRPRPKGVGAYTSGRTDISERAEELMRSAARSRRWR